MLIGKHPPTSGQLSHPQRVASVLCGNAKPLSPQRAGKGGSPLASQWTNSLLRFSTSARPSYWRQTFSASTLRGRLVTRA